MGPRGWDAEPRRMLRLRAQTRRGSRGPQGSPVAALLLPDTKPPAPGLAGPAGLPLSSSASPAWVYSPPLEQSPGNQGLQ